MNTTPTTTTTPGPGPGARPVWHGVNLGGWLLLEKWIKPSLFTPIPDALDEYSLCMALGPKAEAHMRRHRETFLSDKDFKWMVAYGLNAVRIPYGYWIVDPEPPFVGGIEYLDWAFDMCARHGLVGIPDLHGAPGFQSPEYHTGRKGHFQWHLDPSNQARTLDILEAVAQRYRNHPGMGAFSVLNEPGMGAASPMLVEFYHKAYERVRRHLSPQRAPIIIEAHTHFRLHEIHGRLQTLGCENVITDIHPYQAFYRHYNRLEVHEHLATPMGETFMRIQNAQQAGPLMVGEWSLVMNQDDMALANLDERHRDLTRRAYAAAQLALFEYTAGWFYWTYKTEKDMAIWSLRECVARGWFPATLVAAPPASGAPASGATEAATASKPVKTAVKAGRKRPGKKPAKPRKR